MGSSRLPQGVRFHLLAYPDVAAGEPVGARDRRAPAEDRRRGRAACSRCKCHAAGADERRQTVPVQFEIDGARSEVTVEMAGRRPS